jgi:hypothetical protein
MYFFLQMSHITRLDIFRPTYIFIKLKKVSQNANKALGGRGGIAPTNS